MTKYILGASFLALVLWPATALAQNGRVNGTSVDVSGTVAVGNTYQTVQAANSSRANCTIQNPSSATESLSVKIGTMAQPYILGAGQSISTLNGTVNATDAITVTAGTAGHAFGGTCQ